MSPKAPRGRPQPQPQAGSLTRSPALFSTGWPDTVGRGSCRQWQRPLGGEWQPPGDEWQPPLTQRVVTPPPLAGWAGPRRPATPTSENPYPFTNPPF